MEKEKVVLKWQVNELMKDDIVKNILLHEQECRSLDYDDVDHIRIWQNIDREIEYMAGELANCYGFNSADHVLKTIDKEIKTGGK